MAAKLTPGDPDAVLPPSYTMTVVAQDPSVTSIKARILTAEVRVPADRLEPGPRSHRFHVVDYDASQAKLRPPAALASDKAKPSGWGYRDRFAKAADQVLRTDYGFHAQNTYAIAARTLASFEASLGRRLSWSFGSPQLFLVPHAFAEANAYYAAEDRALYFGYCPAAKGDEVVYTCLSHDVVAHECAHAILDGLRPRFIEPGLPDQAAFHEAFADVVALLSVFAMEEVVANLLGPPDRHGRIPAARVSPRALKRGALLGVAEQLGAALSGRRANALRRSALLAPTTAWRQDPSFEEPHRRGEVVVAAVMATLLAMWRGRLTALIHGDGLDRNRAAEEGAKAAGHLLAMVARAIDYCPPVEFEFADFLDAVLVSDAVMAPDDHHGYRSSLASSFAAYGIVATEAIVDLGPRSGELSYHNINLTALRADRDEVYRFIWQNAAVLDIAIGHHLQVSSVRPSVRVGPDGLVVNEAVADYTQILEARPAELERYGLVLPSDLPPDEDVQLWGGGVVVFDQFGKAKFHHHKPLRDWRRQTERLAYLVRCGASDTLGRFGFSLGTTRGQHFAELHAQADDAVERW